MTQPCGSAPPSREWWDGCNAEWDQRARAAGHDPERLRQRWQRWNEHLRRQRWTGPRQPGDRPPDRPDLTDY